MGTQTSGDSPVYGNRMHAAKYCGQKRLSFCRVSMREVKRRETITKFIQMLNVMRASVRFVSGLFARLLMGNLCSTPLSNRVTSLKKNFS